MRWLDKLERKMGKFYITNLILYVMILNGFVYMLSVLGQGRVDLSNLVLIPEKVMQGEVWRLITFIFIPPMTSPIWAFFTLYFYYIAGKGLEHEWGEFKFNVYYFIGAIATIAISFLTGAPATGSYINMSLFLAFAMVYPDYEILLFFVLPLKVKYLGWFNWALILYQFITAPNMMIRILVLTPAINFLIFFGRDLIGSTKNRNRKRNFNSKVIEFKDIPRHRCAICGITDKDDPDMQFRYCSKCSKGQCYCMDHIGSHEHK